MRVELGMRQTVWAVRPGVASGPVDHVEPLEAEARALLEQHDSLAVGNYQGLLIVGGTAIRPQARALSAERFVFQDGLSVHTVPEADSFGGSAHDGSGWKKGSPPGVAREASGLAFSGNHLELAEEVTWLASTRSLSPLSMTVGSEDPPTSR